MAKYNIQLVRVQNKEKIELNPLTTSKNVSVVPSNNIPKDATDTQKVFDAMGSMAFDSGDSLVYIKDVSEDDSSLPNTEINDKTSSAVTTFSSNKITELLKEVVSVTTQLQYVDEDSSVTANCKKPTT